MKLSEAEWALLEILWREERCTLGELTAAIKKWNKNTVYTYLTRMEAKGLVAIDRTQPKPYSAAVSREACASRERQELLHKVYGGAAGDLIAAFLKDTAIPASEVERLKKMLEEMEV
ncbi:MAG: BlaI/MecI/CopY family transcriptional regulator [Clostridia bacterium]|nr:BlaI/MecI/CopY family transcriptional regulator [Clostridia bacterium]